LTTTSAFQRIATRLADQLDALTTEQKAWENPWQIRFCKQLIRLAHATTA
jgi:hypothetical protein